MLTEHEFSVFSHNIHDCTCDKSNIVMTLEITTESIVVEQRFSSFDSNVFSAEQKYVFEPHLAKSRLCYHGVKLLCSFREFL